ncbi:unnamed protein product [Lepidochelys olivacea]
MGPGATALGALLLLLGQDPWVLPDPQCLDYKPPFQPPQPLAFCPEYSAFGCCDGQRDAQLSARFQVLGTFLAPASLRSCWPFLRDLLCQVSGGHRPGSPAGGGHRPGSPAGGAQAVAGVLWGWWHSKTVGWGGQGNSAPLLFHPHIQTWRNPGGPVLLPPISLGGPVGTDCMGGPEGHWGSPQAPSLGAQVPQMCLAQLPWVPGEGGHVQLQAPGRIRLLPHVPGEGAGGTPAAPWGTCPAGCPWHPLPVAPDGSWQWPSPYHILSRLGHG